MTELSRFRNGSSAAMPWMMQVLRSQPRVSTGPFPWKNLIVSLCMLACMDGLCWGYTWVIFGKMEKEKGPYYHSGCRVYLRPWDLPGPRNVIA